MSNYPLDRKYRRSKGLMVDTNLKNVGSDVIKLLLDHGITYISLKNDNIVEGRSWEMAAATRVLNKEGAYSGEVSHYKRGSHISFGYVPALNVKTSLIKGLKTSHDLPYISLSR